MLSAGSPVSLLQLRTCGVSLSSYIPQDKEGYGSEKSHEENVIFIFEESSAFRSNQQVLKSTITINTAFI
jgi:hypothetical protein